MAAKLSENNPPAQRPKFLRIWLLALIGIFLIVAFGYYQYRVQQESFANTNYFRVLSEATSQLDENLDQLISLYEWDESEANIRAILPSYKSEALISAKKPSDNLARCSRFNDTAQQNNHFTYEFDGQQFLVHPKEDAVDASGEKTAKIVCASVASEDILPLPKAGFILYLFVDQNNSVIASSGEQSALSIINVEHISRLIAEEQNLSWQDLATNKNSTEPLKGQKLPGFNHYLDLQLTAGEYRIFIYPYQLSNQSKLEKDLKEPLYVLGVLPKPMLKSLHSQRWNLSLLSITLVVLIFAWVMSRLYMLSNNQPVGDTFYYLTMGCSYLLFVTILALLFAYGEKTVELEYKKTKAKQLLTRINYDFDQEVGAIITELDKYREYYRSLITELQFKKPEITPLTTQLLEIKEQRKERAVQQVQDAHLLKNQNAIQLAREAIAKPLFQMAVENIDNLEKQQKQWSYSTKVDVYSDISAPENFQLSSAITDDNLLSHINFFAPGLRFIPNEKYAQWADPSAGFKQNTKILNTLLLDKNGSDNTPMFFFIESNKKPLSFQLAHRQYFRNIRDQKSWSAKFGCLPQPPVEVDNTTKNDKPCNKPTSNFYIQRLLNLNNGTRGSTIAMPLYDNHKIQSGKSNDSPGDANTQTDSHHLEGHVMVADIALPSLTMTEFTNSEELLDMTFMVVDRDSGQVLFHLDEDRTLVENLFSFGQGTEKISHRIRTGLNENSGWVQGFYHGISGAFSYQKMPIDKWALVIFMPNESLDIFMTNLFLFNSITLTTILLLFAFFIVALRRLDITSSIKQKLSIPLVIERRKIMVFSSIYIASIYLGIWLGSALDRAKEIEPFYVNVLSLLAALTCLTWGYFEYQQFYGKSRQAQRSPINSKKGAVILTLFYLTIGIIITPYVQQVSVVASSSLHWYYTLKMHPARLNQERQELHNVALNRYPNSISRFAVDPLTLMPISDEWRATLSPKVTSKTYMHPKDVQHFGKLVNTSDLQDWLARYLNYERGKKTESQKLMRKGELDSYLFAMIVSFLLLCGLWLRFNRFILATRLFGSPEFLRHLNQIMNRQHKSDDYYPDKDMVIDLDSTPYAGHNLALLLQQWQTKAQHLPPLFSDIFNLCPSLVEIATQDNPFPNMKISLEQKAGAKAKNIALTLWDIEMTLDLPIQRKMLLGFVNHLKSLKLAGHISKVTIVSEFHSLQRLCLKDTLLSAQGESPKHLEQGEYFSWAECLMDFSVAIPLELQKNLDLEFIQQEVNAFPMLEFLRDDLDLPKITEPKTSFNLMRWINLTDWQKTHSEWASINFILLKAEALYRFKWETCSAAEKLALFYLARNERMNPANPQMLEHLALNGLIKIKRGRIRIVNKSFAYFVRYAEDKETLQKMVAEGNLGKWQDYRVPVTLLILMIIGTIALTSGNSLYMIVASTMGVLGTIGSLSNSANLIRNNIQK